MSDIESLKKLVGLIHKDFSEKAFIDLAALPDEKEAESHLINTINSRTADCDPSTKNRILKEFLELGPLELVLADPEVTEVLVNGRDTIWIERRGCLFRYEDCFLSELTFRNAIRRLCRQSETQVTLDHPYASGAWMNHRLQIVGPPLSKDYVITLRAHPQNPWTISKLVESEWCDLRQAEALKKLIRSRMSAIIIGPTGAGKTSVLGACLQELESDERAIILEDTDELKVPNESSTKLLTRIDPQNILPPVHLSDLLRHSLRLRPDRLILGEVRGPEAKDLMLALATGHSGSFGTLHANSAQEALLRLEMLVQLGAPQWTQSTVRRLIHLSLHYIIVAHKQTSGRRFLEGIYRLSSLEEFGFLVEKIA
jgi:pilus assembly protein CpaF